jgi:hypothetical protein
MRAAQSAVLSLTPGALVIPARLRAALAPTLLVLCASILAIGPHGAYPYPIHVDEWTHLAYAEALVQDGVLPHGDPLYGEGLIGFRPELGFRALLAELHLATGLPWESMFPALAGAVFVLFVGSCFHLGRAMGAGPWMGVLALGAPTTVRFLGPAFVVPVAVALTTLVAAATVLLLRSPEERRASPVLTGALLAGTLFIHPPTALMAAMAIVAVSGYAALRSTGPERRAAWACMAVGIVLPLAWYAAVGDSLRSELADELGRSVAQGEGLVSEYLRSAGFVRVAVFAAAVFALIRWAPTLPHLALIAGYAGMLAGMRLHEMGVLHAANFYDRAWLYLDLLLSAIGALGLTAAIQRLGTFKPGWRQAALRFLPLALGALVAANAWQARSQGPLYFLASKGTMEDFRWIGEDLGHVEGLTLLDPDIAVTYPAIAGRPVYASVAMPKPSTEERVASALALLTAVEPDAGVLAAQGIGIVYQPLWEGAEGLTEVRPGVFVVTATTGDRPEAQE